MRMKRAVAVEPDKAATSTAVRRLLNEISTDELELLAIQVIQEHRRRLQRAEELFEALERGADPPLHRGRAPPAAAGLPHGYA